MALGLLRAGTFEIEGEVKYLTKASKQVGDIYFQLPGKPEPSELFYGTWENISDEFPGDFLRVEGGNAETFDSDNLTEQGDAIRNITGSFDAQGYPYSPGGLTSYGAFKLNSRGYVNSSYSGSSTYERNRGFDASLVVPTAVDNRPVNRTIRIWERIPEVV